MDLTASDLAMFASLGIGADLLARAGIERVTDLDARGRYGFNGSGDNAGIIFPYLDRDDVPHTHRLRRDHPEVSANGHAAKKYLSPYGDRRHLFIVSGDHYLADDSAVPVVLVEAEKSVLAIRAAADRCERRILPVGLGGCWGWRGRIGKVETAKGERVDEVGPLPELGVCSNGRQVYILLDANAATNESVKAARAALARQIEKQGAEVRLIDLPALDGVNGPDDFIGQRGDEALWQLFDSAVEAEAPSRFSEDELALRFSDEHPELRYTAQWGKWHAWGGCCWREDDTLNVFDKARKVCRSASAECSEKERATKQRLSAAATVAAVERLARCDRRHAATVEQWDAQPWLLNTPRGTVDLHTGELRPARQDDYLTRSAIAAPSSETPKLWLTFLNRIMGGDEEQISYLQRVVGYCLTGVTREHAMFFSYGTGANGKTVFVSTIAKLLGDYATTAPMTTFTASKVEQHPTDLAGLRGARLVTSVEVESNSRWAEAKIKALTGGDRIAARFMRQDFFEFTPEFKLIVAGNHKPGLRAVDEAIRRRLHLVPFTVTIPEGDRDPQLAAKLEAEYPGILGWAINGCLAWQQDGLNPPEAVRSATTDYLQSEDVIGRWLEDQCATGRQYWTASAALYGDYKSWCERTGEYPGSAKRLSLELESRGFTRERTRAAKGFKGLALSRDVEVKA